MSTQKELTAYLVGISESPFGEGEFAVILAFDEETAVNIFLRRFAVSDACFREHVYSRSVNMSFAEHFWLQTDEEQGAFSERGLDGIIVDEQEFIRRVREFFGKREDFADLYLEHWFDESQGDWECKRVLPEWTKTKFPPEMLAFIWKQANYSGITAHALGL